MTQAKKKAPVPQRREKSRLLAVHQDAAEQPAGERTSISSEWEAAAQELGTRAFEDYRHAVEALVEVVLQRAGDQSADRDATKALLEDLLLTDPELEAELRTLLTIRR